MATAEDKFLSREIEMLSDDLMDDLQNYLDAISTTGRFATIKKLDGFIDPQVRLRGTEGLPGHHISVPLGSRDALKLIEASQLASSETGNETVVDAPGGKWEIDPDQFSLGEHWQPYVNSILKVARDELGIRGDGVTAKLHKMLLYEKRATFKHDGERESVNVTEINDKLEVVGVFATLVVSLPSAHWGGAVVVSHDGQRYSLQTNGHEYLAWYSDVSHEVQEVTSGYRWVLTYNLVQTSSEYLNSAASGERRLRAILTEWNRTIKQEDGEADKMIYQLDHKYTDALIRLDALRGKDLLRAQRLLTVGDQLGYTLYLGESNGYDSYSHYEEYDEGSSDDECHAITSVTEESLNLTTVFDTDGNIIITDLEIEDEDVLPWESYEDRDPERHVYDRWEGNSTHWYTDTVLLLIPNEYIVGVFLGESNRKDAKVLAILRHLAKRHRSVSENQRESLRNGLRRVCLIVSNNRAQSVHSGANSYRYPDSTVSDAIAVCAELSMTDVLLSLSSAFKDGLSTTALTSLCNLRQEMDLNHTEELNRLEAIFGRVVLGHKSVSKKYETLSTLIGTDALEMQDQEDCVPELKAWVARTLATIFSDPETFSNEDGNVIARFATSDASRSLLRDRILPNIERQMKCEDPEKTAFMITFLSKMFESPTPLTEDFLSICRPLIRMVAANLCLRKARPSQPQPGFTYGSYGQLRAQEVARKPALDGRLLANVLGYIMKSQLYEHSQLLIDGVIGQASSMDPQDYKYTILPLLKGVIIQLLDGEDALDRYKKLFQTCLSSYVLRFVGNEPVQINWTRNPVRCSCRDCTELNNFLRSPVDRERRIAVSKQRRHHLHIQLDAHTDCTHVTDRGYIETMVVSKQGKSFGDDFASWSNRAVSALSAIRSLEDLEGTSSSPTQLEKLLGDSYEEIMTLKKVRIMTAARQQPTQPIQAAFTSSSVSNAATVGAPNPTATQSEIPQIAGRKRKAVVIDLSDD